MWAAFRKGCLEMPAYDFRCDSCHVKFEIQCPVADRGKVKCPKCGAKATQLFSVPRLNIWPTEIYHEICPTPLEISSKRQLREECKKRGLIPLCLE